VPPEGNTGSLHIVSSTSGLVTVLFRVSRGKGRSHRPKPMIPIPALLVAQREGPRPTNRFAEPALAESV